MKHILFKYLPGLLSLVFVAIFPGCKKDSSSVISNGNYDFKYYGYLKAGKVISFNCTTVSGTEFWDFGDGSTVTWPGGSNINFIDHTYGKSGMFTVTCIIDNDTTKKITKQLEISSNYNFFFTGIPMIGDTIYFRFPAFLPPENTYLWTFGDGSTSTDSTPSHVYTSAGNFHVNLILNNDTKQYYYLFDGITISRDPVYTRNMTNMRLWHGKYRTYYTYSLNGDTSYMLPDKYFSLNYKNELTVTYDNSDFVFDQSNSNTNVILFIKQGSNASDVSKITYNFNKDSISIYTYQSMQSGPGQPWISYEKTWISP